MNVTKNGDVIEVFDYDVEEGGHEDAGCALVIRFGDGRFEEIFMSRENLMQLSLDIVNLTAETK